MKRRPVPAVHEWLKEGPYYEPVDPPAVFLGRYENPDFVTDYLVKQDLYYLPDAEHLHAPCIAFRDGERRWKIRLYYFGLKTSRDSHFPELREGYRRAVAMGLIDPVAGTHQLDYA